MTRKIQKCKIAEKAVKFIKSLLKPRKIAVSGVQNFVKVETVEKYGVRKFEQF